MLLDVLLEVLPDLRDAVPGELDVPGFPRLRRVIVDTDKLLEYCLWHAGLNAIRAKEWEQLLDGLQPNLNLSAKIDAFRFSDEQPQSPPDSRKQAESPSAFARNLLKTALAEEPMNLKSEKSSAVVDTPEAGKTSRP